MAKENDGRAPLFQRALQILLNNRSILPHEREELLELIQTLAEADVEEKTANVAGEIESKRSLINLIRQQADELNTLKGLSLNLTSSLNLQTVLNAVVKEAMQLVKGARNAHIFLYKRGKLEFGASLDREGTINQPISVPRRKGLTETVAHKGQIIVVEDMSTHSLYAAIPHPWKGSIIGIPLKINHTVVGVMNLSRSLVGGFKPVELRLLGLLADQAAVAISNASLHKAVAEQAKSDVVTGLPNRRALDERLEEEVEFACKTNSPFAVMMMDLDGFKSVNDAYGHAVGDDVLRSAFNHLASGMRAADFLARYGGDELTLILRQTDLKAAKVVGEKVLDLIKEYRYVDPFGKKLKFGLTGGIAVYPIHSKDGINLLRAADAALYQAKKHQRGTFIVAKKVTGALEEIKKK